MIYGKAIPNNDINSNAKKLRYALLLLPVIAGVTSKDISYNIEL
jgi:hypothetical protein